jgi:hypothetical protein
MFAALQNHESAPKSFFTFLKKAWQDTFLSHIDKSRRDNYHFVHYFMGWPLSKTGSKGAYFLTLKFLTTPFSNLLSLIIEFPLNCLSEFSAFFKEQFYYKRTQTHGLNRYFCNFFLLLLLGFQGLFKGIGLLLKAIISPRISYQTALRVNPILGYVSILSSVCFIGLAMSALIVFAPIILSVLLPADTMTLMFLNVLANPFVQLFSSFGMSISTASGAMLSFLSGTLLFGILHLLGRKIIYPESPPQSTLSLPLPQSASKDCEKNSELEEIKEPHYAKGSSDMLNTSFGKLKNVHEINTEICDQELKKNPIVLQTPS